MLGIGNSTGDRDLGAYKIEIKQTRQGFLKNLAGVKTQIIWNIYVVKIIQVPFGFELNPLDGLWGIAKHLVSSSWPFYCTKKDWKEVGFPETLSHFSGHLIKITGHRNFLWSSQSGTNKEVIQNPVGWNSTKKRH